MQGKNEPAELRGIIPRTFAQIMDAIITNPDPTKRFLVQVSFLEIYNEVSPEDLQSLFPLSFLENFFSSRSIRRFEIC